MVAGASPAKGSGNRSRHATAGKLLPLQKMVFTANRTDFERENSEVSVSAVVAVQDPLSPGDTVHVTWFAPKGLR